MRSKGSQLAIGGRRQVETVPRFNPDADLTASQDTEAPGLIPKGHTITGFVYRDNAPTLIRSSPLNGQQFRDRTGMSVEGLYGSTLRAQQAERVREH